MSLSNSSRRPYKNIETVFIKDFGATGRINFSRFINIGFDVDEVIVQSIVAKDFDYAATIDTVLISTDMLPNKKDLAVLYYAPEQARVCHSRFPMQGLPVIGNFTFSYSGVDGGSLASPSTFTTSVVIELLFIQY